MSKTNKYVQFYRKKCHSIDARTFTPIRKQIFKFLKDEECPNDVKIMFGDWLFRKIYMYFKLRDDIKEKLISKLIIAIDKTENPITKAEYLKFHDMDALSQLALNFYLNRFRRSERFFILQMMNDVQLVKNYVQDPRISDEGLKTHFLEWLNGSDIFEQRSNLLDVLLKYYPRDTNVLRTYERMRYGENQKNKFNKSVYDDKQNVHDADINNSVLDATGKLLEWNENVGSLTPSSSEPQDFRNFALYLLSKLGYTSKKSVNLCKAIVERLCIDVTSYNVTVHKQKKAVNLAEVFLAIVNYIYKSDSREILCEIFLDELKNMVELCSTGYVARFLNVLQGFDDRFKINISFKKQLTAVLSYLIQIQLEKAPEEVIFGSFEEKYRGIYIKFILGIINGELLRLNKDYGKEDVKLNLVQVLQEITGIKGWRLEQNNILVFN